MVGPTPIDLDANELNYCPFVIRANTFGGSCNTIEDLFGTICILHKIEDVNQAVFNMIRATNESKKVAKHISCTCRCEFDGRKYNWRQKWDNNK